MIYLWLVWGYGYWERTDGSFCFFLIFPLPVNNSGINGRFSSFFRAASLAVVCFGGATGNRRLFTGDRPETGPVTGRREYIDTQWWPEKWRLPAWFAGHHDFLYVDFYTSQFKTHRFALGNTCIWNEDWPNFDRIDVPDQSTGTVDCSAYKATYRTLSVFVYNRKPSLFKPKITLSGGFCWDSFRITFPAATFAFR